MNYMMTLAQYDPTYPSGFPDPHNQALVALGLIILAIYVVLYFVPYFIAKYRNLVDKRLIFWLNLLVGWTVVIWIILFIVALVGRTEEQSPVHVKIVDPLTPPPLP